MNDGGVQVDIFSEKRILSVSQLTNLVAGVLEENFEHVWVEGEVSNLSMPVSGHLYFTLKDSNSQLRAVMFKGAARLLKFKISDGMQLIVRGRVSVFAQRGEYQLITEYLEPKGIGALQLAFIQLKEKLFREGLFDEARKKLIPGVPARVGIVTSPTGAAIHDILHVLERRFSNIHVILYPVKVQGEGAAEDIASAIADFNRYANVDVLIVGRGGGSMEDLWAFNEEVVARSIAASGIPVISAVGHEIDITISDLVADLRAPTPSAAAELVIASKAELAELLHSRILRLKRAMFSLMKDSRGDFEGLNLALKAPSALIGRVAQTLDYLSGRLEGAALSVLARRQQRVQSLLGRFSAVSPQFSVMQLKSRLQLLCSRQDMNMAGRVERFRESVAIRVTALQKLSPLATLGRGYCLAYRASDSALITGSKQITAGELVVLKFSMGSARCVVREISDDKNLSGAIT